MIRITVDARTLEVEDGANLLKACLDNGIFIPNLCYMKGMGNPPASCRLCFVDIEGEINPVASCTVRCADGMVVETNTPRVRELQWMAFELIMSTHRIDCGNCLSKNNCALIEISRHLKIRLKPVSLRPIPGEIRNEEHPCLIYDSSKCVRCGRCIYACEETHGRLFLTYAGRGIEMGISFFGDTDDASIPCGTCLVCVKVCPVSALVSYRRYELPPESRDREDRES